MSTGGVGSSPWESGKSFSNSRMGNEGETMGDRNAKLKRLKEGSKVRSIMGCDKSSQDSAPGSADSNGTEFIGIRIIFV